MAELIKIVPASSLRTSGLLLSTDFRDAAVPETGKYILQNKDGKQTSATITRKPQGQHERCDIHGGWRAFARENSIGEGDEIRLRHLGGRVIEIVKIGRTGTPSRTPAKAAKTPGKTPAHARRDSGAKTPASGKVKTPGSTGGVAKRRSSSSAKKAAVTPAGAPPARRRSSQGVPARAEAEAEEQQGGGWCTIM